MNENELFGKEGLDFLGALMRMERISGGSDKIKEILADYDGDETDIKTMITVAIFDYCNEHGIPFFDFISDIMVASLHALEMMGELINDNEDN